MDSTADTTVIRKEDKIIKQDIYDISDPDSLAQTIVNVQTRVKVREAELKLRLSRLPKETMKSATLMVVPALLTTKLTGASVSATWNLLKLAIGQKKAVFPLVSSVAKAGIFSLLRKRLQSINHKN